MSPVIEVLEIFDQLIGYSVKVNNTTSCTSMREVNNYLNIYIVYQGMHVLE